MSDRLDRFTPHARHVLTAAQEAAVRLNHNSIGAEHLLLGLAREENGLAVQVLRAMGVEPGQIVRAVERTVPPGVRQMPRKPQLTDQVKRIIEFAVDEARQMEQHTIGTEHLLLGIVRQGDSIAIKVLQATGINLDAVRTQTELAIQQRQAQAKQGPSESKMDTEGDPGDEE